MNKEITWGRFPPVVFLIFGILYAVIVLIIYLATKNVIVTLVSLGIVVVLILSLFLHCFITTTNYYIGFYGLIPIIYKRRFGLLEKANLDVKFQNIFFIDTEKERIIFILFRHNWSKKITKKEQNDKTDYKALFESLEKDAIMLNKSQNVSFNQFGGKPNVPANFVWPKYTNDREIIVPCDIRERPMSFLLQVNIKDLKPFDRENLLPNSGVFSLFYDNLSQPLGENEHQQKGLKLFYFDESISKLKKSTFTFPREEWGSDSFFEFEEYCFEFSNSKQIPEQDEYELTNKVKNPNFCNNKYYEKYFQDKSILLPQILGFANSIQAPAILCCNSNATNKKFDYSKYILLFQITSDYSSDTSFHLGDAGHLYIFISKEDLKNKQFDKVRFTVDFG